MNTDEKPSTVTFGLSGGAAWGVLQFLGISPNDFPSGSNVSVEILISNDYNPSDPAWLRLIDYLSPDEYGISASVSGSVGAGLGGHLVGTIKAYPNSSAVEVISPGDTEVSLQGYGGGPIAVFDENGALTGGGFLLGYGAGYDASLTIESLGITIDVEDFTIKTVVNGEVKAYRINPFDQCFPAGTPILLADGTSKPIEAIRPEDRVMTYDNRGTLVPSRVTRTFVNDVPHVLDFHGTGVTPGHVFLCGAGRFAGRHVPLIDILRDDGAVVRQDGSLMRAATGCAVGSEADRLIEVVAADGTTGRLRAGTRFAGEMGEVTVSALIAQAGGTICDGRVFLPGATAPQPFAWAGSLPAPEDYVLRQSGLTLAEIYAADEWESPPQMAAALDFSATPRRRPAPRHRVPIFEVDRTRACL